MIDFGNFYSLIAKNHLSHWLETLPAQIANWQREQQHGLFKQWSNAVEFLPEIKPYRLELKVYINNLPISPHRSL